MPPLSISAHRRFMTMNVMFLVFVLVAVVKLKTHQGCAFQCPTLHQSFNVQHKSRSRTTTNKLIVKSRSRDDVNEHISDEIQKKHHIPHHFISSPHKNKSSNTLDSHKILQNANVNLHLSSTQTSQHYHRQQQQIINQNNRRQFFSSILLSSAVALLPTEKAYADEITWSPSPINKRSGITVYKAEETYNIRFITYLSRFLLTFDEECQKWWYKRGATDIPKTASLDQVKMLRLKQFGSFAASVEVGLQEYEYNKNFDNKGDNAADDETGPQRLMKSLLHRYCRDIEQIKLDREKSGLAPYKPNEEERVKGEIKEARRQIALLFGLLNANQPVQDITKLLAAIDNASVKEITIIKNGSGYAPGYGVPAVTFPPPDAGEGFLTATGRAKLRPNGQILRVDVQKRGFGYSKPPTVTISSPMSEAFGSPFAKAATAKAFIFRDGMNKGRIERIELTSPGNGYKEDEPIKIKFSPPDLPSEDGGEACVAEAILEYEVAGIEIVNPGTGYASEKPLQITVDPPPLTARVNLNDPMVVKNLSLDVMAGKNLDSSQSQSGLQSDKPRTMRKNINDDNIFDPSSMKAKAWKMAKIGGPRGCVGRECYDDPVIAYAYPVADANSYSSFRSNGGNKEKDKISAMSSGEEGYVPQMPFYSTTSSSLISLLPKGVGLSFNTELKRYELVASADAIATPAGILSATPGKPIDTDFGPRGRSPIEREKKLTSDIILRFFAAGALCCSSVHLVLTPLDVVKTNIQTDPEKYTNPIIAFNTLLEESGIPGFFAGWVPTFVGFFVNGGLSYAMTEFFRRFYFDLAGDVAVNYEIPIIVAAAATSAFFGVFTLTPSEAIRIRSVAQPDYAPNAFGVATRMINEEGIKTLFSAVPVFMLKEIPFCIAKFTIFDVSTEWLYDAYPAAREDLRLSLLVTLAGGTLGGISAAFVSNPADATVSAMKKAKSDDGPVTTFLNLIETGGIPAIFRGLGIRMFFYTLIVGLQFLVYDAIRFSFGVGTDDLKLYLDVLGGALRESGAPI